MKLGVLFALSLAFASVTLLATADEAAACKPPTCPGWGTCVIKEREVAEVHVGDLGATVNQPYIECYY